jgi:hypothetical protein
MMKFSVTAILLLGATTSSASEYDGHALIGRSLYGGKKGDMDGGKKGDVDDCTKYADVIDKCFTEIDKPGRYTLDGDLTCGDNRDAITIIADNVHLDCQGNRIQGIGQTTAFGISVSDSAHVTVSNCHESNFSVGLLLFVNRNKRPWDDLVVRDSTFNNNTSSGMELLGDLSEPSNFYVVDSTFNANGDVNGGTGLLTLIKLSELLRDPL